MASLIALGLLFGLVFGGMMLALVMGYINTEQERAKETTVVAVAAAEKVASLPQFFLDPNAGQSKVRDSRADADLVSRFEDYLRREQAVVARFVNEPSIDNLYRESSTSPFVH